MWVSGSWGLQTVSWAEKRVGRRVGVCQAALLGSSGRSRQKGI